MYDNGFVHNRQEDSEHEKACQEVQEEYAKGMLFVPKTESHLATNASETVSNETNILPPIMACYSQFFESMNMICSTLLIWCIPKTSYND